MVKNTHLLRIAIAFALALCGAKPAVAAEWAVVASDRLASLGDDDIDRHATEPDYLKDITISEWRFSEAGFDWHLIRFVNSEKPVGPLWAVPHDDENAAFEAAIAAVRQHGGVVITVNSGPGSSRFQQGSGTCGGRPAILARCDPNRNFSNATPLYTQAFLDELAAGQPIIALHTNSPGHGRGQGDITIVDAAAAAKGQIRPRTDGYFGINGPDVLQNHDTYAIIPYLPPRVAAEAIVCRTGLVSEGVHVWHERVGRSDGSLSNYVAREKPDTVYVNMESRRETDLALAASRHGLIIEAYMKHCNVSGN
jgi:hypothetical protein